MSNSYTIFVGDLSVYCTRDDLVQVFSTFGPIKDIRIKQDEETGKYLSYGFIEFEHVSSAVNVLRTMNGYVLCGRPMRVRWGANKSKRSAGQHPMTMNSSSSNINNTSAVHVTYVAQSDVAVTEEGLRNLFSSFGYVLDATIKKISFSKDENARKGYGFVHFGCTQEGIEAAIRAATVMASVSVEGVQYTCCLSKNLEARLNSLMNEYGSLSPSDVYNINCYYYAQHQQQAMMYAAAAYHQQLPVVYPSQHPDARFVSPMTYSPVASPSTPDIENQIQQLAVDNLVDTPKTLSTEVDILVTEVSVVAQKTVPVYAKVAPEVFVKGPSSSVSVASKVSSIAASMDELQQQLDELRVSCGTQKMSAEHPSAARDEFSLEADEMISVINIHDY